jgi:hypothetical protein
MKIVFIGTVLLFLLLLTSAFAAEINCWFPPDWSMKTVQAQAITKALSDKSGITVKPLIAKSYPEILSAFASENMNLVYAGSFVQAIIKAKELGTALVQNIDGKELYSGVLVYPKGEDPETILKNFPAEIAYTRAASSGETTAKLGTGGKANIAVASNEAVCGSIILGRAKAGMVKSWWWEKNKEKYTVLDMYKIPGVSIDKYPDNIMTASQAIPANIQAKITEAAIASPKAFGSLEIAPFVPSLLAFPLEMMAKAGIDPKNYKFYQKP